MKFLSVRFRDEIIERENSKVFINDDLCRCTRFLLNSLQAKFNRRVEKFVKLRSWNWGNLYCRANRNVLILHHGTWWIVDTLFIVSHEIWGVLLLRLVPKDRNERLIRHRTTWIFFQSLERFEKKECSIFYLRSYQPQREFSKVSIFRFSFLAIQFPSPKLLPSIN